MSKLDVNAGNTDLISDISPAEFEAKMNGFKANLDNLFAESRDLEAEIKKQLGGLVYE